MTHDLTAAELRAINDYRTAARKLSSAFKRNGFPNRADKMIDEINDVGSVFGQITGTYPRHVEYLEVTS